MYYRITKYNPRFRDREGRYRRSEWTAISDIGKVFNGTRLSKEEYLQIERAHIDFYKKIVKEAGIRWLKVVSSERMKGRVAKAAKKRNVQPRRIEFLVKGCLRERFWCKLEGENFYIHFGYDYYTYLKCDLSPEIVCACAAENELFCDVGFISPYSFRDPEDNRFKNEILRLYLDEQFFLSAKTVDSNENETEIWLDLSDNERYLLCRIEKRKEENNQGEDSLMDRNRKTEENTLLESDEWVFRTYPTKFENCRRLMMLSLKQTNSDNAWSRQLLNRSFFLSMLSPCGLKEWEEKFWTGMEKY